ncbi:MAG: sensor histidine kinase [Gemmatimonadaceae bacterium]
MITVFLVTQRGAWLYVHQVLTGWTALALLWAALSFARQLVFRRVYAWALLVPVVSSYVAIYVMQNFLVAALLSVVLLSAVTAYTGWLFAAYWRRVRSPGALMLALTQFSWAVHHLDYPFLRARGAWSPWGYYLDIVFLLATAASLTVLVLDDLRRGFGALASLSGSAIGASVDRAVGTLLQRALELPATRGAAYFGRTRDGVTFVRGTGECEGWGQFALTPSAERAVADTMRTGSPQVLHDEQGIGGDRAQRYAYVAVLAVTATAAPDGALVIVGDYRDPFAALDAGFLVTLGQQIGGALRTAALTQGLQERSEELARLSARTVREHEGERRRLSRELHDETAQVFSAVKLQLGMLQERTDRDTSSALQRIVGLVDDGMRSIRSVTESLRPVLLDELGLIPALRSLAGEVAGRCGLDIETSLPAQLERKDADVELVLYRALQESLSNVVRHADATRVHVSLASQGNTVVLTVADNGRGLDADRDAGGGLAGMRERVTSLGGALTVSGTGGGTTVRVELPGSRVHA